jgi:hypothetical protein
MTGKRTPTEFPSDADDRVPESLENAWRDLDHPEPPALVDQGILNRARAAVDKPHSNRPWSFGWIHTVTTAAVIVLGVTLLLPFREPAPPIERPAPAASPPAERERATAKARLMERQSAEPSSEEDRSVAPGAAEPEVGAEAGTAAVRLADEAMTIAEDADDLAPEQWLEDIRALVEAGRVDEARSSLDAFLEAWPDYPVPDDLVPDRPESDDQQP